VKSKLSTYLLLAVAAGIWGVVVWRLFFAKPGQGDLTAPPRSHKTADTRAEDTLYLDYRDPFDMTPVTVAAPQKAAKPLPPKPVPPPAPQRPNMRYTGLIVKNGVSNCLVEVERQQYILKIGDTCARSKLVKVFSDSIYVVFQKKTFTIKLSE